MLKYRIKRRMVQSARIASRLAAIEASIRTLADEDLLDLADIFKEGNTPLADMASSEMLSRNLAL